MHHFHELVYRSTSFTLNALEKANDEVVKQLEEGGSTSAVKNLQMLQLQKAILATGMFSLFDSILQNTLTTQNGFDEAKRILLQKDEVDLHNRFQIFILAINVLKHGKGRSYDSLIGDYTNLPFIIKLPNQDFFFEGDVSEVSTLVQVDDQFVLDCAEIIEKVSNAVIC